MIRLALASLLALLPPQLASAEELGRLFHTPGERKALDASRTKNRDRPHFSPKREPVRLDGYVVRSHGPSTVWIDGRAVRLPERRR